LENWRRPAGRPCTTWLKTIHHDLKSNNLSINDAVDVAQNRPLWRLMSAFGGTYCQWCMPEKKKTYNLILIKWDWSSIATCAAAVMTLHTVITSVINISCVPLV